MGIRKNELERNFEALATSKGWRVTKKGWPDFLCVGPKGEVIVVEVKPRNKKGQLRMLRRFQERVMDLFVLHGIRCYVSDGVRLEAYNKQIHADPSRRHRRLVVHMPDDGSRPYTEKVPCDEWGNLGG